MTVPNEIKLALQQAIIHSSPPASNRVMFDFGVYQSRQIYESFDCLGTEIGVKARAWLAIITTKHVIEKFADRYAPVETSDRKFAFTCGKALVDLAEQIISSKHSIPDIDQKAQNLVNDNGYNEDNWLFYRDKYIILLGYTCLLIDQHSIFTGRFVSKISAPRVN